MDPKFIRNFSIVAHIDHGKTTLSDRLLELTGTLSKREMEAQFLDGMDLEKERGITIKAHTVSMHYTAGDGQEYLLNLIDTPGHVDFGYQVSSALAACEGALLVVDATQGVQAQTLANAYLAIANDLEIIPVINKVDLPAADPDLVRREVEQVIGLDTSDSLRCSAKSGIGVPEILEAVVNRLPPPTGSPQGPLRALIFDSWYDNYRGVVMLVRVVDGSVRRGQKVRFMSTGIEHEVTELGMMAPRMKPEDELSSGMVGYLVAGVKDITDSKVGDTVTAALDPALEALPGFKEVKPMVFAGLYPVDSADYENLRDAVVKLRLNDGSFSFQPETSEALGFGFRCGFLGLLHMEIIQERLEREYGLDLINTAPSVSYRITTSRGEVVEIHNPSELPDPVQIEAFDEPVYDVTIITQDEFLGQILPLMEEKRGIQKKFEYIADKTVMLVYKVPLNEIVIDFYDKLKSISRGYASMDYHFAGWEPSDLVKLDVLVNTKAVDALSVIVHRSKSFPRGRALAAKLKELIPRQLFEVVIQAAIGKKVIAREVVKALRKNVLAKCYGGDITRKRKLLEKQKEGKKRMKSVGSVEIPQEAFLSVLKIDT